MFVRTAGKAVQLLLGDLQRTVACVTLDVLRRSGAGHRAALQFGSASQRAKVSGQRWIEINLAVEARQDDEETRSWRTHVLRYDYSLYGQATEGKPLIAYHFHPDPEGRGHPRPHLHLSVTPRWAASSLERIHLPTGRMTCEAFVRMLIEDFAIATRRDDWPNVLADREDVFATRRTW